MVEYAITRFRSETTSAIVAAMNNVAVARIAATSAAVGASSNSGCVRAIRYTPAVTMVAAWISAETGVGPSIASGNQVCSGTWADFANAPTRSIRHAPTSTPSLWWNTCGAWEKMPDQSRAPVLSNSRKAAITRPTSPITFITNALMPARTAVSRRYQNEIKRYDAAPTNAHPTISRIRLEARTKSSIEKTKKFRYEKKRTYPRSESM